MRILLFNLSAKLSSDGPRLIASLLKREGHKVKTVYLLRSEPLLYNTNELLLLDEILNESDLVMIAVYSTYALRAVNLTEFIHNNYPNLKVIWGGPHCISAPELSIKHADGVCFSEADESAIELVNRIENGRDYLSTPNMAFNVNGNIVINNVLPPFLDLDNLPYCDYDFADQYCLDKNLTKMTKETFKEHISCYPLNIPTLFVLASRGCPNNCSYCSNCRYTAMFNNNPIRIQSNDRTINELKSTLEKLDFVEMIGFGDDDFFVRNYEKLEDFAGKYKRIIDLPFMIGLSANSFNKKKMEILLDSGLKIIQMGVQSGSERVLKEVFHRNIKASKTKWAIQKIAPYHQTHALDLLLDFIIDNPYEFRDDIMETYKYIVDLPYSVKLNIFLLSFFPGTPIYEKALKDGVIEPFNYESFRFYRRGQIKYQKNYETFIVLLAGYLHGKSWMKALLRFLGSRFIRFILNIIPRSFYAILGNYILNNSIRKKNN